MDFTKQHYHYKTTEQGELSLTGFVPQRDDDAPPAACALFFHGGGWAGGAPFQFDAYCQRLAEHGVVAFTAQYRLIDQHGTTIHECIQDAKSAARWVRAHSERFNIDPQRFILGGASAGGHLASVCTFIQGFDDPADDLSLSTRPQALVLLNPVVDMSKENPESRISNMLGDHRLALSPLHNVDDNPPPVAIFHGEEDQSVSASDVRAFAQAIESHNGRCELHLFPGEGHGFLNQDHIRPILVEHVSRFVESLGYFDKPSDPTRTASG